MDHRVGKVRQEHLFNNATAGSLGQGGTGTGMGSSSGGGGGGGGGKLYYSATINRLSS